MVPKRRVKQSPRLHEPPLNLASMTTFENGEIYCLEPNHILSLSLGTAIRGTSSILGGGSLMQRVTARLSTL